MQRKPFTLLVIFMIFTLLLAGCTKEVDGENTYISIMSVPTEAIIPNGLILDSILSISNTDPANPEAPPTTAQLGVFGYTNKQGEVHYYVYGKKEAVDGEAIHLIEQGFYPVNYSRDNGAITLSLKDNASPINKLDLGVGTPTLFQDELPLSFYTPTELPGVYTFADANGKTNFRVYSTFLGENGNFFPAGEDGTMVAGSLPINISIEEILQSQGSNAASRLLTTPIECTNIPTSFQQ
ncbi:hypothetical protein [Acetobacterium bakii]|uniref:Lipoprotein n=1 Tax=Acetobacterium bakii TaxID=52689 RepID=A0A0L6TX51_9FIRM|nr:hypothetical protein [Acetobacterium bakii]KNZ40662.1 hypothetical protein AKG39_16195 [Acetobacterium bakii]